MLSMLPNLDLSEFSARPEVLKADYSRFSIDQLRQYLAFKSVRRAGRDIHKIRVMVWLVSRELSRRGIAPNWQGLPRIKYMNDEQLADLFEKDQIYYDLEWLRAQFPDHRCNDLAFQRIFSTKCSSSDLRWVARRKLWIPEKLYLLNLSFEQEIGCVKLRSAKTERRRREVKQSVQRFESKLRTDAIEIKQLTEEHQKTRLLQREAAHLANFRPAMAARIYGYMTGETISRQRMNVQMPKLKIPKPRKFKKPVLSKKKAGWTP